MSVYKNLLNSFSKLLAGIVKYCDLPDGVLNSHMHTDVNMAPPIKRNI